MKKVLRLTAGVLRIAIAVYLLFFAGLFFFQEKLLFHPRPVDEERIAYLRDALPGVTEQTLETADGYTLHGWVVDNTGNDKRGIIFYFGGNAEEVSGRIGEIRSWDGWRVVLFNYRGYGKSGGAPGEDPFFRDALLIYDRFAPEKGALPIIAMGWSMGTGVAVHLARHRPVDALFLISPYDSITQIARQMYPFVPVGIAIRHPFDSVAAAPEITAPAWIITASGDRLIPHGNSARLAAAWGGTVELLQVPGYDHNSLTASPEYAAFLAAAREKIAAK